jgi:3'(2'), 5'-bisphosphate nucleotidase
MDLSWIEPARLAVSKACTVASAIQARMASVRAILKSDQSPVTVADFASQAVIAHFLERAIGPIALVGEEDAALIRKELGEGDRTLLDALSDAVKSVWSDATDDGLLEAIDRGAADPLAHAAGYWTLDPIDGTKGFIRGEHYAISLAFIERGLPVFGVLGCPKIDRGTIQHAIAGGGAFEAPVDALAGARRIIRGDPPAEGPIRLAESFEPAHSRRESGEKVAEHLGTNVEVVRLDSQAKYAIVARNDADLYVRIPHRMDYVERIWDHAAGALVAEEAGCRVTDMHGVRLDFGHGRGLEKNRGVVVAPPMLHAKVMAAFRADPPPGRAG